MESIEKYLKEGIDRGASDFFLIPGAPLTYKIGTRQERIGERLTPDETKKAISEIYELAHREHRYEESSRIDDDFSFAAHDIGRFRLNVYHQRGSLAAVIRIIRFGLPDPDELNIPDAVMKAADIQHGLVLVTGPAANGKSTTLACLIDRINSSRSGHIITVEDPIEFVHPHKSCLVSQREIATDVDDYEQALNSALRESPDTILFGEMRTQSTVEIAMRAAETGQLMLSTLHTLGGAATITRIIDTFPAEQQAQARTQLSQALAGIISQKLVPTADGSCIPVFEIMFSNPAIRNLIRENKIHQIDSVIQSNGEHGMHTMDSDLLELYREGRISKETVLENCLNKESTKRQL